MRRSNTASIKTRILFHIVRLVLVLIAVEVILQAFALIAPVKYRILIGRELPTDRRAVKDSKLGYRYNSSFPGIDKNGFRNDSVPAEATIVTLGDSQTYGEGVSAEEAWPRQLISRTNLTVYSMAIGGWGPTQSLMLFNQALSFKPKLIVEAFYSGNDLYDSFTHVYYLKQLPELKTTSAEQIRAIENEEGLEKLDNYVRKFYVRPKEAPRLSIWSRIARFADDHCRSYQLALRFWNLYVEKRGRDWSSIKGECEKSSYCEVFESPNITTLFTCESRFVGADLRDARIQEGFRISLEAIRQMNERARAANTPFAVLLLPTKELAHKDVVYEQGNVSASFQRLVANEETLWQQSKEFFRVQGIPVIDALPALRTYLNKGIELYPATDDGHPNASGHRAIAELVESEIRKLGLLQTTTAETRSEALDRDAMRWRQASPRKIQPFDLATTTRSRFYSLSFVL